jgi:hypothetical protein
MSVPPAKKGDIDATRRSRSGEIDALFRGSSLRKASSLDLGWQGVALERRTAEPGERSEEHVDHHFIVLWDRQPALGERADLRGKFAPYAKYPGAISLGAAGILPAVRARTRSDVIACTLDPALTDHLEQELDSRPTASLHERAGIEDEGLHRLLLLLLSESDGGGSYGRLYADALIQALATRFLFLARSERPPDPPRVSALPRRILQRVLDRMHADFRLYDEPDLHAPREELSQMGRESAEALSLQPMGQRSGEKVLGQGLRRLLSPSFAPQRSKFLDNRRERRLPTSG